MFAPENLSYGARLTRAIEEICHRSPSFHWNSHLYVRIMCLWWDHSWKMQQLNPWHDFESIIQQCLRVGVVCCYSSRPYSIMSPLFFKYCIVTTSSRCTWHYSLLWFFEFWYGTVPYRGYGNVRSLMTSVGHTYVRIIWSAWSGIRTVRYGTVPYSI